MIKPLVAGIEGVTVQSYDCLTVEYAASVGATAMLRGLRSFTDVQYELQLALTNRAVAGVETVFIMTSEQFGFTSSTLIREIAKLGGNVSSLIPQDIFLKLQKRLTEKGIQQEQDNCIE
jgi:pantetheine-phosphate adenylyltransferase